MFKNLSVAILTVITFFTLVQCQNNSTKEVVKGYYSDYFVFLSDNLDQPLIIPSDINWHQDEAGSVFTELKSWYGTSQPWPMIYYTKSVELGNKKFPNNWTIVPDADDLDWDNHGNSITSNFKKQGKVTIKIVQPNKEAIVVENQKDKSVATSAVKTYATIDGKKINGWLIHEVVRRKVAGKQRIPNGYFSRYFWIPVIQNNKLYLFNHDGLNSQFAVRWQNDNGLIKADTVGSFMFQDTKNIRHEITNRDDVPVTFKLGQTNWGVQFVLDTINGHTGYGNPNNKGIRPLYRQALVQGQDGSGNSIYGMLELILDP